MLACANFLIVAALFVLAGSDRLLRNSDKILKWMKGHKVDWRDFKGLLIPLREGVLAEMLVLFILAIVAGALLIGAVFAVHWLISLVRKRRTRVFISFQHEREPIADALVDEMTKCGIRAEKLPFVESPDSDRLLIQVKQQIRDCDVFVCVPGKRPSFVDYEVGMAFQIDKLLLFVLIEADAAHLPNTALKGYPVFALERLEREGFRTLANFCSYLAADSRSTARLYAAVFHHLKACAGLAVSVFLFSAVILTFVMRSSPHSPEKKYFSRINHEHTIIDQHKRGSLLGLPRTVVPSPATLGFFVPTLILFLVPYSLFFMNRLTLQANLRAVISGKKFSRDTFIPETLAYGLKGADLHKILYHGDIVKHHESGRPDAKSP